jgi:hypothetical protein
MFIHSLATVNAVEQPEFCRVATFRATAMVLVTERQFAAIRLPSYMIL